MGGQFSGLVTAVYCLYSEEYDSHRNCRCVLRRYHYEWENRQISTEVEWDEEGRIDRIRLTRRCVDETVSWDDCDPIEIELEYSNKIFRYVVDGKELCYAIAKACTQALKKYGFRGYHSSSGSFECFGDVINVEQLLFVKAYALDALEVRELRTIWEKPKHWMCAEGTSFEKEIELLQFDM